MPLVFISHSTADRSFIDRELLPLLTSHGIQTWYAHDDIKAMDEWERSILRGLRSCDYFLVVMSPRSAQSRWVKREVDWVFNRSDKPVVPILIEDCDADDFHLAMAGIQFIDFRYDPGTGRQRLLTAFGPSKPPVRGPGPSIRPVPRPYWQSLDGALFKKCREALNWSPQQVAEQIGTNPTFVSLLEAGTFKKPANHWFVKLADLYQKPLSYFLGTPSVVPQPPLPRPRLLVMRGRFCSREYEIREGENILGCGGGGPVAINLAEQEPEDRRRISPHHARLVWQGEALTLEDLISPHGSFVNRVKLLPGNQQHLQSGDIIQVGSVQLKVHLVR
jgi:transcriptional regulator with XRE-family HTH domain